MASSQRPSGQLQVDDSRWVVVYPAYLNADYSFAKVRRPRGAGVSRPGGGGRSFPCEGFADGAAGEIFLAPGAILFVSWVGGVGPVPGVAAPRATRRRCHGGAAQ